MHVMEFCYYVVVFFRSHSLSSNFCLPNFVTANTQKTYYPHPIRRDAREHAFIHCKHHKMIKHRTLLLLIEFVSSASAIRTTVYAPLASMRAHTLRLSVPMFWNNSLACTLVCRATYCHDESINCLFIQNHKKSYHDERAWRET